MTLVYYISVWDLMQNFQTKKAKYKQFWWNILRYFFLFWLTKRYRTFFPNISDKNPFIFGKIWHRPNFFVLWSTVPSVAEKIYKLTNKIFWKILMNLMFYHNLRLENIFFKYFLSLLHQFDCNTFQMRPLQYFYHEF